MSDAVVLIGGGLMALFVVVITVALIYRGDPEDD